MSIMPYWPPTFVLLYFFIIRHVPLFILLPDTQHNTGIRIYIYFIYFYYVDMNVWMYLFIGVTYFISLFFFSLLIYCEVIVYLKMFFFYSFPRFYYLTFCFPFLNSSDFWFSFREICSDLFFLLLLLDFFHSYSCIIHSIFPLFFIWILSQHFLSSFSCHHPLDFHLRTFVLLFFSFFLNIFFFFLSSFHCSNI